MFANISLGQYIPVQSLLHNLDPRTKIITTIILVLAVVMSVSPLELTIMVITTAILIKLSRVNTSNYLEALKPFRLIIIITAVLLIVLTREEVLLEYYFLRISLTGIKMAIQLIIKLILIILLTRILTLTTTPVTITDGLEHLMSPLKKIRFPVHELVMIITISLRFIPLFIEESQRIKRAQISRGADYSSGTIRQKVSKLLSILIPLMRISFRRADDLALAMESRCYQGAEGRGHLYELSMVPLDYLYILIISGIALVIIII